MSCEWRVTNCEWRVARSSLENHLAQAAQHLQLTARHSPLTTRNYPHDPQSFPRRCLPLARRAGLGQLLRPLPVRPQVVLGNLLVDGWFLKLYHRPLAFGADHDPRLAGGHQRGAGLDPVLDLLLRGLVGDGRSDLRADHTLPRHVAGNGGGPRLDRSIRHAGPADLPW